MATKKAAPKAAKTVSVQAYEHLLDRIAQLERVSALKEQLETARATVDRLTAALRDIHEKAQTFNDAWVMAEAALAPADPEGKA